MVRYSWVLPGGPKWPNLGLAHQKLLTRLYYSANDIQVSASFFDAIRKSAAVPNGVEVGIVYGPNWDNYPAPEVVAAKIDQYVRDLGATAKQMAVIIDQEEHDSDYILAILRSWRALRPTRPTGWTLEGHQDWVSVDLANFINQDPNTIVMPQLYTGAGGAIEQPVDGAAEFRRYCMSRANGGMAIYPARIVPFVTPRWKLPAWWEGCLFQENWDQLANA